MDDAFGDGAAETLKDWGKIGQQLSEKFKLPIVKLREELMEVEGAFAKGAISFDVYKRALDDINKRMRETDEWSKIGDRLGEKFKSPMQQLQEDIAEVNGALARGKISWSTYDAAIADVAKRFGELDEAGSKSIRAIHAPSVGAATRGTTAGFSAVRSGENSLRAMVEAARKSEAHAKRQEEFLRDIHAELKRVEVAVRESKTESTVYRL
jgi:hypothetical protein